MTESKKSNRYEQLIEYIFRARYRDGAREVPFERTDIEAAAQALSIKLPSNIGDVIYSFRYRADLPQFVTERAPQEESWIIMPMGRSRYAFVATQLATIQPNPSLAETKILDAIPGIIARYALNDEQALLAKLRYNRLIDIFAGITCYSLQNHLRTAIHGVGQVETDELYVGVDKRGVHYVIPVQAKGGKDRLSVVQIQQDVLLCEAKFPALVCRPIAAQFMRDDVIALFEFEKQDSRILIAAERHYRLVPPDGLTEHDLTTYRARLAD